ncbi:hypothetical protein BD289DRAFT_435606 [Coniella lustricola]|uniref:Pentacotripeptide-repeat region of PRORP domain-containing protein n=1 Tax=Coniella lustricola TaxID=2025994 RepID=A0A2T3A685_9PEZI|nr:hypothetical protein BD289DRAFT_435606 [Coniella lustricola]
MQASHALCSSYRRQLLAAARQRAAVPPLPLTQLQARAAFRSTATAADQSRSDDSLYGTIIPSLDALDPSDWNPQETHSRSDDQPALSKPVARGRTPYRRPQASTHRDVSLNIFRKVVKEQDEQDREAQTNTGFKDLPQELVDFYSNLAALRPMMKVKPIDECLVFYLTEVWPKAPHQGNNRLLKQRGVTLMSAVASARLADPDNAKLPTVAEITQYFWELDALTSAKWTDMAIGLIQSIVSRSSARSDYPSDAAHQQALARKEELLDDLVASWIKFIRFRLPASEEALQTSAEAEFRLPGLEPHRLRKFAKYGNLLGAFDMLFGQFARQPREIPAAAIATFVLLSDPKHTTAEIRRKAEPLLTPLTQILAVVQLRRPAMYLMLGPYPVVLLYVSQNWDTLISEITATTPAPKLSTQTAISSEPASATTRIKATPTVTARERAMLPQPAPQPKQAGQTSVLRPLQGRVNIRFIHNKLMNALGLGDVNTVETVYQDYWAQASAIPGVIQRNAELMDDFIMAFTALRRPQRAVDVWAAMEAKGVAPTLKTWTSMIEGCRRANNPIALENVWKKLVATGVQLDPVVWTARIVGLMRCRQPEIALRALREMQLQSNKPNGVPLNITAINAAVSGLVRLNSLSAARDVLAWASEHGLEPDTVTYNSLLGPLVQRGEAEEVHAILKTMIQQRVDPDSATWTILLDGLISSLEQTDSPAEQRKSIEGLFHDMEQVGLQANMETFGRMIHLILREDRQRDPQAQPQPQQQQQQHHHTRGAVAAVLDHIRAKGLEPSPHIYTMLIDYYFSRSPPAYNDVRDLLIECGFDVQAGGVVIQDRPHKLDKVLLERLIRGYALTGSVDNAFSLFKRCQSLAGSSITLEALEDLVRSLVDVDMMAEAKQVVDAVRIYRSANQADAIHSTLSTLQTFGGVGAHRQSSSVARYWNHGFWAFALDRGLLTRAEWENLQRTAAERPVGLPQEEQPA